MPIYYGNSGRLSVSNWRDALETIKAGREEYKKYYSIMTPYERSIIERDLQAKKEQYKSLMTNGILGEYQTALDLYQLGAFHLI